MKSFKTSTIINASTEAIWETLIDVANWPAWNPTVTKVEGTVALGEKLTVFSKVDLNRAFPLTVSELVPHQRMVWSGGMPLGLFRGNRTYTLTQRADGSVVFFMEEAFSGLMAPLITKSIPDLQPSFEAFARALKQQVEEGSSG